MCERFLLSPRQPSLEAGFPMVDAEQVAGCPGQQRQPYKGKRTQVRTRGSTGLPAPTLAQVDAGETALGDWWEKSSSVHPTFLQATDPPTPASLAPALFLLLFPGKPSAHPQSCGWGKGCGEEGASSWSIWPLPPQFLYGTRGAFSKLNSLPSPK